MPFPATAPKPHYPTPYHNQADDLLRELATLTNQLTRTQTEAQAKLDALTAEYAARTDSLKAKIEALEKSVQTLAKRRAAEFFDGTDRVDLQYGALLHSCELRVKKAREVLKNLEALGFTEAIKIVKSVDWDRLESWTDERLIEVGTERVRKESFTFELFEKEATLCV